MRRLRSAIVAPCLLALASGCAGHSVSSVLPPAAATGARAGTLPSQLLFIPTESGTIDIYNLQNPNGSGAVAQITGLQAYQQQLAVDAGENLFVVNNGASAGDDYVSEYAPPYDGAPIILSTSWKGAVFFPIGVTADASGTVYVTDCGAYCFETPGIFIYPPGATSPAKRVTSPQLNSLGELTADAKGNLYVFDWDANTLKSDVFELRAGSKLPRPLHLHGLDTGDGGNGVSLDAKGDLFVAATSSGSDYIMEYRPGARNAFRAIDSLPFTDEPAGLDVGPDGNLYASDSCAFPPCTWVYGFKSKGKRPFEEVGTSQSGVAILGVATAPNLRLEGGKR